MRHTQLTKWAGDKLCMSTAYYAVSWCNIIQNSVLRIPVGLTTTLEAVQTMAAAQSSTSLLADYLAALVATAGQA